MHYKLQDATANCCKLYFIDDDAPVFLHTDASNYGIGGYLYQVIDDARVPIQFVSRKLNKRELKWNTVEKEAYAIFHCLMKYLENQSIDKEVGNSKVGGPNTLLYSYRYDDSTKTSQIHQYRGS